VEPATTDRIQRMIDAEATERFPPDAVPRLVLLPYGDHPVIEQHGDDPPVEPGTRTRRA
jgi:hypothetical protein